MNKTVYKILKILVTITCFLGVSVFFIISSNLADKLGKHLHLLPSYTGGEIAADFYDDAGDDNGNNNLVYPSNSVFAQGSLDLVHYTVHEPVLNAKWQNNAEYWQIVLEYKNGPANVRNIMIYIDSDNLSEGCTEPLFDSAENVVFDENHPWDFAIWICDRKGKVYDNKKNFICQTEYYEIDGGKTIKIKIPLQDEYLQTLFGACKTYHYVLTGGYSTFDRGGFMPLEKRRSISRGGTKSAKQFNALIPKVYDVLGNNEQLGTWNAQDFTKATLVPVEVEMHPFAATGKAWKGKRSSSADEDEEFINKVFEEYKKYASDTESFSENPEESAEIYKAKLKENPDDYVSMAYYGSCLALEGGKASVLQAVALVNQSFEYLDKAVELSRNKDGEIEVLMNRASVAYSVPNDVFGKAEVSAGDFMRIIELYKASYSEEELSKPENRAALAYCYTMASRAYEILGRKTDKVLSLQEAKKLLQ